MWARFTVLNETPIASAIAGCVIPLSRSNTIWMRSRCAAGIFHRSAVFSSRICFLVHLTIRPPESDSQSESYPAPSRDPKKRQKSLDSNSYGSGIRGGPRTGIAAFLAGSAWRLGGAMLGGWVSLIAYAIVIWAMHYGPMGPLSALREASVLFAALIGRLAHKERLSAHRFASCIVVAGGAACLGGAR